jgi:oligoendopeptidase F
MSSHKLPREKQLVNDTWNLSPLFLNLAAWKKEFSKTLKDDYQAIVADYKDAKKFSPKSLFNLLTLYFRLERQLKKLYTWAHLFHDQDIGDDEGKQAFQAIMSRYHLFCEEMSWIEPKILSHNSGEIQQFLKSKELAPFRIYLQRVVRNKPHVLSASNEALISMAQQALSAPHRAFCAINDADLHFPEVVDSKKKKYPVTHGTYGSLLRSTDRKLREHAFISVHSTYSQYTNTIAELLQGQVQHHVFEARARKFNSSLEASLFSKNIPKHVYTTLIETVREGCKQLHRYVALKKRALKLQTIAPWDLYAPIPGAHSKSYSFEEAVSVVIQSCAPLGKHYVDRLTKGLSDERWVDRYENLRKRSGAYSSGCYDSHPYILMNYTGTLRDVFTLAHEAGHSMHSALSKSQPYHYSDYEIFVAEVASTFNEALLAKYLVKKAKNNPAQKALLLHERLEELRTTLFRQTMFAEFELFIHDRIEKSLPLTPNVLSEKFLELNAAYYGPHLSLPPELGTEWARIPHFYYNFYVYQYATGVSAAYCLSSHLPDCVDSYLEFLSSGSSDFPLPLLKKAGVDMSTSAPIQDTIAQFGSMVDELSKLLPSIST